MTGRPQEVIGGHDGLLGYKRIQETAVEVPKENNARRADSVSKTIRVRFERSVNWERAFFTL